MEALRALDYNTVRLGSASTQLAADMASPHRRSAAGVPAEPVEPALPVVFEHGPDRAERWWCGAAVSPYSLTGAIGLSLAYDVGPT
jgi:hypothetical protein